MWRKTQVVFVCLVEKVRKKKKKTVKADALLNKRSSRSGLRNVQSVQMHRGPPT